MTTSVEVKSLTGLLPAENDDNNFRYYHCILTNSADWVCEERYKMTGPGESLKHIASGIHPANITKCIPIRSTIPKIFDPLILKYEMIPKVEIKK